MPKTTVLAALAAGLLGVAGPAAATGVTNGDFSRELDGWTTTRPVQVVGGKAVLEEGPVAQLTFLQQEFVVPDLIGSLSFWRQLVSDPDGSSQSGVPDGFAVSLLDPDGDPIIPSASSPPFTDFFYEDRYGTIYNSSFVSVVGNTVTLDLSTVPAGRPALLIFDLLGWADGFRTRAEVDDVALRVVPEPITGLAVVLAAPVLAAYLRRGGRTRSTPRPGAASPGPSRA